jgi:hypothetical protein
MYNLTTSFTISEILVEDSNYQNRGSLKKKDLLKDKLWSINVSDVVMKVNGLVKNFPLILDHINGVNSNRLEFKGFMSQLYILV